MGVKVKNKVARFLWTTVYITNTRSVERGICPTAALYLLRFTLVSYDFLQPMLVSNSNISLKISKFGSRDIVGHAVVRLAIYGVLQAVSYNHMLILHGYRDLKT